MNTKSWMLLIFFLFASLLQLVAETSSEQQVVERALRLQYADVQYHPTFGGWYLLTTRHKGQVSYAMADAAGHIVVTGATDYKRHDAYIRFCFVDHEKKRLHEQWQKQWKDYEVAYANYCKVKDEYEQRLNAYNIQVEAVKLQANERYKREVAEAQRKAQAEYQRQSSNQDSGGLLGGVVKAIASAVVKTNASNNINYEVILSQMLDDAGLLVPPTQPYNPQPSPPQEPHSGYEWKCFTYQQPCPYNEIDYEAIATSDGFADVKRGGRYGLVNAQLEELIPCKYDEIRREAGYFWCKRNDSWGVYSDKGEVLVPVAYDSVGLSSNVFIATLSNGSSGLVTFSGQELFPFVAYQIVELQPDFILVRDALSRYGAINYQGKLIVPVKNKREHVDKKVAAYAKKVNLTDENQLARESIKHAHNAYLQRDAQPLLAQGKQPIANEKRGIAHSDVDIQIPVTSKKQENTFAVIIANKNYDEAPNVDYAFNDGYMFKEYCIKTLGIPSSNIRYKEDATFNNIREAVNWIRDIATNKIYKGNSKFIFYYSGHGVPDELTRSMYLLPKDGVAMNIAATGYNVNDLYQVLSETSSESLVLLDACFSGFTKSGAALASTKGVVKVTSWAPKGNTVVFSASSSNEVAHQYEEKSHGLFTYYLLKKLQETKGDVSLGDLFAYIEKEVVRTSVTVIRKSQTPSVAAGNTALEWQGRQL